MYIDLITNEISLEHVDVLRVLIVYSVRLAGDNRPHNAGRLELYYNNRWGTVCDSGFDNTDAQVACYSLGFL